MILFILDKSNSFTIEALRKLRSPGIAHLIGLIHYDELDKINGKPASGIVFSDFDRLKERQIAIVSEVQDYLRDQFPDLPILNSARKYKSRYRLLRDLYDIGINQYNVYRPDESREDIRFPVFLRIQNEHLGSISSLIHNHKELQNHINARRILGYPMDALIITEFLDVSDELGLYNKLSATIFDNRIFPHFYDYYSDWQVKTRMVRSQHPNRMELYREFVQSNPWEAELRNLFQLAGVDYGRVDFSLYRGGLQFWEINLNPSFGTQPSFQRNEQELYDFILEIFHVPFEEQLKQFDQKQKFEIELPNGKNLARQLHSDWKRNLSRRYYTALQAKRTPYKQMAGFMKGVALNLAKMY